ncbi:nucleolar MIF4G domain-containing protein 1-like [Pocillopora damicornis]|uniref:nucleolar MIF4G domain-containing protein 1-like n=1 Tax=Pocillopora damicornis TaxID=46731 RepID=UPI000F558EF5|nr:nucleolar MIF4G domain-containing protein 1-like [Pocillopora damicornis]
MADPRGRKRKKEKRDEFLHIQAKGQYLKIPKGQEWDEKDPSTVGGKEKTRKSPSRRDKRQQARVQKKARKAAFFSNKKGKTMKMLSGGCIRNKPKEGSDLTEKPTGTKLSMVSKKKRKRKRTKKVTEEQEFLKLRLLAENRKEDKEIKRLEKLLKLGSKEKVTCKKFKADGLDYLLEVCEHQQKEHDIESGEGLESRDEMFSREVKHSDIMGIDGNPKQNMSESAQHDSDDSYADSQLNDDDDDDIGHNVIDDDECNDSDSSYGDDIETKHYSGGSDDSGHGNNDDGEGCEEGDYSTDKRDFIETFENDKDIYFEEEDSGSKANSCKQTDDFKKYVPPHLRNKNLSQTQNEHLHRLSCQIKGLLNRLNEGNMSIISKEIEQIYMQNSRNDINKILSNLILASCVSASMMPDKLLMEHIMLLAILSSHVGIDVAAFFIERLAELFDKLHKSNKDSFGQGKECYNVIALFSHLCNFKVTHCCLIYDIIQRLVNSFGERDIELLLLLLKLVGAEIRRGDPSALKEIILQIQAKATSTPILSSDSRVCFMLEIIAKLRNNNLRKIPGYDSSQIEHLRKTLHSLIRESGCLVSNQLRVSLQDLLNIKLKGRWWTVGYALPQTPQSNSMEVSTSKLQNTKLLELARKQRMNTDVRKNVFLIMMTSEDYIDAFEKLIRLNLKDVQTREVIHVLIDCCIQEKMYNPYYAYLGQKFCENSRSYQVTFQYSFWDKFKLLSSLAPHCLENLLHLMCHLFATRALSLSILKVVNFMVLEKTSVQFFTDLFHHLLSTYSKDVTRYIFERISMKKELAFLCQNIRIFLQHFVGAKKSSILEKRLNLVDGILGASHKTKL